jgi:membrane protease YdiL (CAAX protease family)
MLDVKYYIYSLLMYLLICISPVILYIKFKEKANVLAYLKLTGNSRKGVIVGSVISIIFVVLIIIKNTIIGFDKFNTNLGLLWISGLLVGFFEEIPFRGFLLQKLWNHMNFWKANLLTTIIFVSFHIPVWMSSNTPLLKAAVSIGAVSLALGYLFKEYKSLWIPIICHSIYNLCIWMGL